MSEPTGKTKRRSLFLIYPKFQLAVLAYSISITVVVSLLCYGGTAWFFWRSAQVEGIAQNEQLLEFMDRQQVVLGGMMAGTALAAIVLVSVLSLYFSKRISGPIRRLISHMKSVSEGTTEADIKFRDKDFFPEMADAFNELMDTVRTTKKKLGEKQDEDGAGS